jgi:peptidoglycan biosynthesis protein MviN/MurJ (putative lipid II flippase)
VNTNQVPNSKPNIVQICAVGGAVLIAGMLAFALMWCAMYKIYIDVPQLMAISTILGGIGGALTTILVGRSISQLNQPPATNGSTVSVTTTSESDKNPTVTVEPQPTLKT